MDILQNKRHIEWISKEHLDDHLQRVTVALQGLPGFQTLSYFGSMAEGRADGYSDMDLIVTTDDLPAAQEHLLGVLESISPVESCWVVGLRPDEWNPTIIFTKEGYYHRLDLGMVSTDVMAPSIPPEQTTLLATRAGDLPPTTSCGSRAYMPPKDSVGHFLLGQYIGGLRYLKARKRGKLLSCYRFVSAAADWCLRALYIATTGEGTFTVKLSTEEYAILDRLDIQGRGSAILATLDYSIPERMDLSIYKTYRQMYSLCLEIANARNENLDEGVFQRMLAFMRDELGIVPRA